MSDGSSFAGTLGARPPGTVAISGSMQLVLMRALTSADDGSQQWGVIATQNGVTVSSSIAVQVILRARLRRRSHRHPRHLRQRASLSPQVLHPCRLMRPLARPSPPSRERRPMVRCSLAPLPRAGPELRRSAARTGCSRALTSSDDGSHQWGVATTENGVTVSGSISVQVNVAGPSPAPAPQPLAPPPPPSAVSPDGSTLCRGDVGNLVTVDGTWTLVQLLFRLVLYLLI
jgi:hypothetical protein